MDDRTTALWTVAALAVAVAGSGFLVWWLGRSYFGQRIWVGIVAALVAALVVVTLAHRMMTP